MSPMMKRGGPDLPVEYPDTWLSSLTKTGENNPPYPSGKKGGEGIPGYVLTAIVNTEPPPV